MDETFLAKNQAKHAFFERAREPNALELFRSALSAEQREYVECLYETYFSTASAADADKMVSLLCIKAAPDFSKRDFFVPIGLTAAELEGIGDAELDRCLEEQTRFAEIMKEELKDCGATARPSPQAAKAEEPAAPPQDPKTLKYKIELTGIDSAKKLTVIKEMKALLGLGLKDAKDLVEKLPSTLKKDVDWQEMETLKEKLSAVGCTLNIS